MDPEWWADTVSEAAVVVASTSTLRSKKIRCQGGARCQLARSIFWGARHRTTHRSRSLGRNPQDLPNLLDDVRKESSYDGLLSIAELFVVLLLPPQPTSPFC